MFNSFTKRLAWSCVIPLLVASAMWAAQEGPNTAKKTVVHVQVTDKKTGAPIGNANVMLKWGQTDSESGSATTNSNGMARLVDVPRGTAVLRVIATGYAAVAPSEEIKGNEQTIKLELEKETDTNDAANAAPTPE